MKCSSQAIAQGLLEKHDWYGALQEEHAYQKASSGERDCDMSIIRGQDYVIGLGKAQTFVQGEARALIWARNQKAYKVYALLGVVDALIKQNSEK
jgi:hypothetical protein